MKHKMYDIINDKQCVLKVANMLETKGG